MDIGIPHHGGHEGRIGQVRVLEHRQLWLVGAGLVDPMVHALGRRMHQPDALPAQHEINGEREAPQPGEPLWPEFLLVPGEMRVPGAARQGGIPVPQDGDFTTLPAEINHRRAARSLPGQVAQIDDPCNATPVDIGQHGFQRRKVSLNIGNHRDLLHWYPHRQRAGTQPPRYSTLSASPAHPAHMPGPATR